MNGLSNINLHDGIVNSIKFFSDNDFIDSVVLEIQIETGKTLNMRFLNCVKINTNFSSWIQGKDSIRFWKDSEDVGAKERIEKCRDNLHIPSTINLNFFWLETNITGSVIEIIFEDLQVELDTHREL